MYSVILMAAMTAPADATSFGWRNKGCTGCTGTACSGCTGCTGYSCGGCSGSSCSGCGGRTGGFLGLRSGGCSGCTGNASCHGAGACYGYSFAGLTYGFAGCYGSCYGSYTNYFSYWSQPVNVHYGYGMPMHWAPKMGEPAPVVPVKPPVIVPEPPVKPKTPLGLESAPASVIVSLPADARLLANGIRTTQTSAERHFTTPALEAGRVYHYNFTVEVVRDGRPITETRQVEVQAGLETRVSFNAVEGTRVAGK